MHDARSGTGEAVIRRPAESRPVMKIVRPFARGSLAGAWDGGAAGFCEPHAASVTTRKKTIKRMLAYTLQSGLFSQTFSIRRRNWVLCEDIVLY
jgi:hypothetical protein